MMVGRILAIGTLALALLSGTGATALAQSQEGIKVHGHWTIEVRNPDGSLDAHHEFNNALVAGPGGQLLAGLLGRSYRAVQSWMVTLVTPESNVCANNIGARSCTLTEWTGTGAAPLGLLALVPPAVPGTLELRGMAQFIAQGTIGSVLSRVRTCPSPNCDVGNSDLLDFTSHTPASPIVVAANQVVQITVVFSFS